MKSSEVPSRFNFTGLVLSEDTKLSSDMYDFRLNDVVTLANNTVVIKIGKKDEQNYSYLKLKCEMTTAVDPDTDITFDTLWRFGGMPTDLISVTGRKNGVYSNVFDTPIVDLIQNEIKGSISLDGKLTDLSYTALGVLGNN